MTELEVLDRVLASTSIASDIFFAGAPCDEWQMSNAETAGTGAAFHLVMQGSAWLHDGKKETRARALAAGDFVFLARDSLHVLAHSSRPPETQDTQVSGVRPAADAGEDSVILCGKLLLEPDTQRFLLAPLPEILVLPTAGVAMPSIVPAIVTLMWNEVHAQEQPLTATLNRLADVLVVQVLLFAVRTRLAASGVFAGLADAQLRRAIIGVVESPERSWTVDTLASAAAMSRSTFAARFLAVVGTSPLHFIREWRMRRARALLRESRSVAEVAAMVGYDSEVAFAKAFKRVTGLGPGAVRRG